MASRRKLEVQEASETTKEGMKIKFEEACIYVTTLTLVVGILAIFIMMGKYYDAGIFG